MFVARSGRLGNPMLRDRGARPKKRPPGAEEV
uniref:Uncharacterized protein n=1 Tax=Arundo donax TaxID=35708 RepID=A0A0A9A2L7_ARUDO